VVVPPPFCQDSLGKEVIDEVSTRCGPHAGQFASLGWVVECIFFGSGSWPVCSMPHLRPGRCKVAVLWAENFAGQEQCRSLSRNEIEIIARGAQCRASLAGCAWTTFVDWRKFTLTGGMDGSLRRA